MKRFFLNILVISQLLAFASHGQNIGSNGKAGTATPASKPPYHRPLLTTEALAIAVAEPVLFSIYGRENILRQRPYRARLTSGFWHLSGTLPAPAATVGGTFYLVIEASNCRVQTLFHSK
ncbi:NTF2 fold immunity protein [Hymenobacter ruricola]|uniref:NTF2 fold domain-containing protein n=1 Tax=Hymenobacter ruricola TaxID=2791023 RepID=A0ABS0I305_9BACT|nr:NTF2 fold immunity protein [Hymenobacter ruricola]MBF9221320.1 hypothetical protein [Hymenobacter ruricola]